MRATRLVTKPREKSETGLHAIRSAVVLLLIGVFSAPLAPQSQSGPDHVDITWMSISNMFFEIGSLGVVTDGRSEEHTSELQSQSNLVCRLLLEKKKKHMKHET